MTAYIVLHLAIYVSRAANFHSVLGHEMKQMFKGFKVVKTALLGCLLFFTFPEGKTQSATNLYKRVYVTDGTWTHTRQFQSNLLTLCAEWGRKIDKSKVNTLYMYSLKTETLII